MKRVRETFTTVIESGWVYSDTGKSVYNLADRELKRGTLFRVGNRVRVTVERLPAKKGKRP